MKPPHVTFKDTTSEPIYLSSYHPLTYPLTIYLSIYLSQRVQLLAQALVRRQVLRPVPRAAVQRHLALPTLDFSPLLAPRAVADLHQLFAKALVLGQVLHGVVLAAVQRHSAPGTLTQDRPVLGLDLARRVLALSDFPLTILRFFDDYGVVFLRSE